MELLRVLLVDDFAPMHMAYRRLLAGKFEVVGEAMDGHQAVVAAALLKPDLAVVDISMPGPNGFAAADALRLRVPSLRIIFASQNEEPAYLEHARRIGAGGYIAKAHAADELEAALREAAAGRFYASPWILGAKERQSRTVQATVVREFAPGATRETPPWGGTAKLSGR